MTEVLVGKIYKHFKGGFVKIISVDECPINKIVTYQGIIDKKFYERELHDFGRAVKNADGKFVPRFRLATYNEISEALSESELQSYLHENNIL